MSLKQRKEKRYTKGDYYEPLQITFTDMIIVPQLIVVHNNL